jgi:NADH:ubiquinone oxidoreductase subunit 4 (subunit M)
MTAMSWIIAGLFLPLFPLGMVFNLLFQRVRNAWLRSILLLVWPLVGLGVLQYMQVNVSTEIVVWALLSAALYGFRAVVVREVGVWAGFLATSSWSLIWVALASGFKPDQLLIHVLAFSLPLVLLVFVSAELEQRYESAYAGIVSGLAQGQPRLSGIFVITLLAAIGSPLFPSFFVMLSSITHSATVLPAAAFGVAAVWLLWSWSGMQLLQELLVGPASAIKHSDITHSVTTTYALSLVALLVGGLYLSGTIL